MLVERADALGGKGALDARIWLDLIIHLQSKTITYGKGIPDQDRLMPTEFMGLVDAAPLVQGQPVTPEPMPAVDPQAILAQARAAKADPAISNGSPLYARALALATQAADFPTFLGLAFADEDILADEEIAQQCAEQSQIWATAHPS